MHCWTRNEEIILTNTLVTPDETEVVTLAEFKKHIRWDDADTSEDTLMATYIDAATNQAADYTRRTLLTGAWETTIDTFYSKVTLDVTPIDLTSLVIKYYDSDNAEQTLSASSYKSRIINDRAVIEFIGSMPNIYDRYDAVKFEYDAGYTVVPAGIKTAIMIQAAGFFENRQSEITSSVSHSIINGFHQLLFPYKML